MVDPRRAKFAEPRPLPSRIRPDVAGRFGSGGSKAGAAGCLGGLWIIVASGLDVALKLAAEGSKSCNRKPGVPEST